MATNSPRTNYALTGEALSVIRSYGMPVFGDQVAAFLVHIGGSLAERYARARIQQMVPVQLPGGEEIVLSPGQHNHLQKLIVEDFLPRFFPGAAILYLGDTDQKSLIASADLAALGLVGVHGKLPDVVARDDRRSWLVLVEAVTSHGPVGPKRYEELEALLREAPLKRVYVSAFLDFDGYKRHATGIAWEMEVWVADAPSHLLHYDGEHFISPAG